MEITCPNCQNTFEAVTRRASCQSCATQLDVWALLSGHATGRSETEAGATRSLVNLPRSGHVEASQAQAADPFSTSFVSSSADVLDLPASDLGHERSPELDPVLDASFSELPEEFVRAVSKAEEALPSAPSEESTITERGAIASEASESLRQPGRRRTRWAITMTLFVLGLAAIYYNRSSSTETGSVASPTTSTPAEAGDRRSRVEPAASQVQKAASPATQTTPDPGSGMKPGQPPTSASSMNAVTEAPAREGTPADSATRARAVNPQTLKTGRYSLQIAAKPNEEEARRVAERLIDAGLDARILKASIAVPGTSEQRTWYRVRVGAFGTKEEATRYGEQLKRAGRVESFFVTDVGH